MVDDFEIPSIPENIEQSTEVLLKFVDTSQVHKTSFHPVVWERKWGNKLKEYWKLWSLSSPIVKYFRGIGIQHPDNIILLIFRDVYYASINKDYDMEILIYNIREHWRSIGEDPDNLQIE